MSRSSIFRDVDKLSPRYVPKVLQHREDQMRFLSGLYESVLDSIEDKYLEVSQLVGPVGTGKTSTAIRFGEMLEEKASDRKIKLKHVYLNGKMEGASRYTLYRSLLAFVDFSIILLRAKRGFKRNLCSLAPGMRFEPIPSFA